MNEFKTNKITSNTEVISEQLRSAREQSSLTVADIAKETGINRRYIELIEEGNFNGLPKGLYGRNYVREYAIYLKLDVEAILKLYDKVFNTKDGEQKGLFIQQRAKHKRTYTIPQLLKNAALIALVLFCFIYLGVYLKRVSTPPELAIIFPDENYITSEHTIKVIGISEPEVQIVINGEQVLTGTNGEFSKDVFLKNGINIITIAAQHKFGRENVVKRQILVK